MQRIPKKMANCKCCFTDFVAKCGTELIVYANLLAGQVYKWVITDQAGNMYEGTVESDPDGSLPIPTADLPPGIINQYAGKFILQIYAIYDPSCTPIKFKIAQETDCVEFDVVGGTFSKNTLGCLVPPVEIAEPQFAEFIAHIDSVGVNDPVVHPVVDQITGIVWTRQSQGVYRGTKAGAFPMSRTYADVQIITTTGQQAASVDHPSDDYIEYRTYDTVPFQLQDGHHVYLSIKVFEP